MTAPKSRLLTDISTLDEIRSTDMNAAGNNRNSNVRLIQKFDWLWNWLDWLAYNEMDWLAYNEMIANPDKFHAIIVKKDRSDTTGINIKVKGQNILTESTVKLLGVKLDYKLNFDPHISDLCKESCESAECFEKIKTIYWFRNKETSSSESCVFKFQLLSSCMAFFVCKISA